MALNFPSSPSEGDTYTYNGQTWRFNGTVWRAYSSDSGLVTGASSAVDGNFPAFDGATGKILKDAGYSPDSFLKLLGGTMVGDIKMGSYSLKGHIYTLPDDEATSFTPTVQYGLLFLHSRTGSQKDFWGIFNWRTYTPAHCVKLTGSTIAVSTSALTGTTGTDGATTVSACEDGKIYIENRAGFSRYLGYFILGY